MKCPFCIKVCTKCGKILVANKMNFSKQKTGKYGLRTICKVCKKEEDKQYKKTHKKELKEKSKQYREEHKKELKEKSKQYREEHKEEIKRYNKKYKQNNREVILKCKERYRENHREELREKQRQYNKNNPQINFNNNNRRRELENNQGKGITKDQWLEMMEFFNWRCAYSGEYLGGNSNKNNRSIDHIIPLDRNGENEIWNLVPMLRNLNCSKQNKDFLKWYQKQEFYSEERLQKIYEWIEYAKNKWEENI